MLLPPTLHKYKYQDAYQQMEWHRIQLPHRSTVCDHASPQVIEQHPHLGILTIQHEIPHQQSFILIICINYTIMYIRPILTLYCDEHTLSL